MFFLQGLREGCFSGGRVCGRVGYLAAGSEGAFAFWGQGLREGCARPYLAGLERAMSAALVAALISSAAPSMWAPTRSTGMPL